MLKEFDTAALKGFPKTRPLLPIEIQKIYDTHYKSNRDGETTAASLAQRLETWMHKKVARDVLNNPDRQASTLEIGAGTLNQLQYEPAVGSYDIIEPFTSLYATSKHRSRLRSIYADISEIDQSHQYDRITSVATFEHILNLPQVVAKSGLLLEKSGTLRVAIPSEGTLLWMLGWKLTTGLEFKLKYGLDYGLLMQHEHVNTASEIAQILQFFFSDVRHSVFGLSKSISLYQYYECRLPNLSRCTNYTNRE
jgi:hypothetical protein